MNILLINHYAGSLRHGMEYRPYYLAREWVREGHQVVVLAASYSHVRSHNPSLSSSATLKETISGVRYIWLKTPNYSGNGVRRGVNILAFVARMFTYIRVIIREITPDLIITSSTHPLDIFPAYYAAQKLGACLVYEVHDLWPLSLIELGGMSRYHPFIVILQLAENFAYKNADKVVSLLPTAKDYMEAHGMQPDKFFHIPNGINLSEWNPNKGSLQPEHTHKIAAIRKNKEFLIGYAGAHGTANALYSLVESADLLKDQNIGFVLVGHGPEKEKLVKKSRAAGLKNILFLDSIPKNDVPLFLRKMDAAYIGLKREPLFRFGVSPNKLIDYMMAARPVIYAIQAGNDMVADSGCGVSIPPEDPESLAKAVVELAQLEPNEREKMGMRGRKYVQTHHDYRMLAHRFLEAVTGS